MCTFTTSYIAETNTNNIFTNKTKTLMKLKHLRLSLLSVLVMLCGNIAWAGENDLTWDYSEKAPASNPDNGLYYKESVNDAAGTKNGLKGVKLNSTGYAFFAKAAVAGKLTLKIGKRDGKDAYAVNVYACTIADGKATKGSLIGEVAVNESPNESSIDIAADVTGIYIERKTGSEGVLSKIVFKETIARTFVDFEIPYASLTADGYTGADLPTGVSFNGTFHDAQHGYGNATLVVPVDGTVKFTISGCRYGNTFSVKNSANEDIASFNQKDFGCYNYDQPGSITYIYTGSATTLTFSNIGYLSYFKAEATEVQEAIITYRDQNGKELGTKKVFEGDPLGEIPYTEADLTIPEGQKFRGWVYANKTKVKATDIVNGNISVNASVTPIESVTVGSIQTYDLTSSIFYPEDHETIDITNGAYYNEHGWNIAANGTITVDVAGNAQVVLSLCKYGNGTTITATDANGNVVKSDIPAKADNDGATTTLNYKGEATKLTLTFAAQSYLHKITVYNVKDFIEKDETTGFYLVPAGDAASFILALNNAASEEGAKIFLPNGTYDFGETVMTGISGKKVSIIGESMNKTIIKNAPPVSAEGLKSASLLHNTSSDLYMQDVTLQNDLDYYGAGSAGRANAFHDDGTHTVAKNVKLMSYQDTYLSAANKQFYWDDSEIHGAVDFICGGGDVFFEKCKLVLESRKKDEKSGEATITAHQPQTGEKFGYVFNNCTIDNQAATFNFGRAWGGASGATVRPTVTYLNTTLNQPSEIIETRFILKGMNSQSGIFHEYNSIDANGTVVSPASNSQTFTDKSGGDAQTYETILTAEQTANYTVDKVLGDWAVTAKQEATQLEAPSAQYANGNVTWTPANDGAIAYMIEKNGEFVGITTQPTYAIEINAETDKLTIRSANARGGFGPAKQVAGTATSIQAINAAKERGEQVIYNLAGQRVNKATKGMYIINGRKVVVK